ncbi:response regulator transcription factor [Dietzia sp.]|uniref:response regulator transcription factor n=1 Tax=Dietzia sp. TaxID=1871616 RepID=UPI002FDB8A58
MKILIADDDPQILRALRITLTAKGYTVITAGDGKRAIAAAIDHSPDLYLLDLGMPNLDGIEVIHAIRGWSQAPILVVSGRAGSVDKVQALDAGADDYVTKPFSIDEFLARIRALARRGAIPAGRPDTGSVQGYDGGAPGQPREHEPTPILELGTVTVDFSARAVVDSAGGTDRHVRLTPTEWKVLELLARNAGRLVTRQTILTHIWGTEHAEDTGYLRLYLSQLRKKLEPDPSNPRFLITAPGMGYRLDVPSPGAR